ncbi:MAG: 50S ribosomal protein L9, partial [Janibacter sp.]|nr:50S ribosomal protein L9 [Janibacter sp.]
DQWTKGAQKQVEALAAGRAARAGKSLEEATSIKGNLEASSVTVSAHAGASGRLFGAVTSREVAEAVKANGGPEIDRRTIEIPTPIKAVGPAEALVRLHPEVQATVTLDIVAG